MMIPHQARHNHLLRALPSETRPRIFPHLALVEMPTGKMLDFRDSLNDVYFPVDAVVAPLHVVRNSAMAQIAVIGCEGVAGVSMFVAGTATPEQAVVQCGGHAFRLKADILRREYMRYGAVHGLILRYTQALLAQMAQTLMCSLHHSLEQRLCRWLLLTSDRLLSSRLPVEGEVIEKVMGAPSKSVRDALQTLDSAGLIEVELEQLTIRDRQKLEHASCECYSKVRRELDRLLPPLRGHLKEWVSQR